MYQTLFVIPHDWLQGWLLAAWLVLGGIIIATLFLRKQSKDAGGFVPVYLLVAAVIYFVVPQLEIKGINPDDPDGQLIPLGLAIRGYGFCMLIGMVLGVAVTVYRSWQAGVAAEPVISLCFWMVICGIVGARVYYIIQYWDQFQDESNLLVALLDMTKGGLVVYGSLIGAFIGGGIYLYISKIDLWKTADIVAPGMMIGLAIGRIGCLMNGCCWGGVCDNSAIGVQFPPGSPPYMRHLETGQLIGIDGVETEDGLVEIKSIKTGSIAEKLPLSDGQKVLLRYSSIHGDGAPVLRAMHEQQLEFDSNNRLLILNENENVIARIPFEELPDRSRQVHPTQIYSAINALLLFAVLVFYHPFRRADGQTLAMLLMLYSPTRFLLEAIRSDEGGQFGTDLTTAQWWSLAALTGGVALFLWRQKAQTATKS